jgi:hypothetical protein
MSKKKKKDVIFQASRKGKNHLEVLDFLMGYVSHICANEEYRSQVGATNRPENIVIRYLKSR